MSYTNMSLAVAAMGYWFSIAALTHAQTLSAMSNLAARLLFLEVVKGREQEFGDGHAETFKAMLSLASTYRSREKFDEAEFLFFEVVKGCKRVFGDEHAETYSAMSNLAATGKYDEAEQLFSQVVEGRKRVFGDDQSHAETLGTISNLTSTS